MHRLRTLKMTLFMGAFLGLALMTPRAYAGDPQLLCFNSVNGPGDLSEWRAVCLGEYIYADFRFRPIDETKGEANVHITSHGVCDSSQRIVCTMNNGGPVGCFEEQTSEWIEYDGYVYGAAVICGCYDHDVDPCQ